MTHAQGTRILTFFLAAFALVFAACRSASPDDKIAAHDDTSFENWISERRPALTAADTTELRDARQTLRYKIMQAHPGMASKDLSDAVYAEIDGKTRAEFLIASYELQLQRVNTELANYQPMLEKFQNYGKEHSVNEEQQKMLNDNLEKVQRLMRERRESLDRLTSRLAELRQTAPAAGK